MESQEQHDVNVAPEPSVDEGAFWHTNMDLYYGFMEGEIVEVEHEPAKYWLARIEFSYRHLVLLKWLGNYGEEFWVDTSLANTSSATGSNCSSSLSIVDGDSNFIRDYPKRLFPLGHHLQAQIKSQFTLERPTKILIKPSLYNPSKDPYANIKTVDDLLAHEVEPTVIETNNQSASLTLVKTKTKINYGQEDVDELEAALQSLEYECDTEKPGVKVPQANQQEDETDTIQNISSKNVVEKNDLESSSFDGKSDEPSGIDQGSECYSGNQSKLDATKVLTRKNDDKNANANVSSTINTRPDEEQQEGNHDEARIELCRELQKSAIGKGRYTGVEINHNEQCDDEIYYLKPKQFFDIGGANHERVFLPGTLLEVCHSIEGDLGLELYNWFAFVVKNVGGRLTLRWYLCDEPKFKQGRLELRSCRSKIVREDDTGADSSLVVNQHDDAKKSSSNEVCDKTEQDNRISAKQLTFCLHFCDLKVQTIAPSNQTRPLKLPQVISSHLTNTYGPTNEKDSESFLQNETSTYTKHIYDSRRMFLDKDRPLIDHILSTVRSRIPDYLDLLYAPKDKQSRREVLISCPKLTKVLRGYIAREIEPNTYEVRSDPVPDGETIRFIYPLDNSYAILPLDWAENNRDCLSIDPSRNTSPTAQTNSDSQDLAQTDVEKGADNSIEEFKRTDEASENQESTELLDLSLIMGRLRLPRLGGSFHRVPRLDENELNTFKLLTPNFDRYDPQSWSETLRSHQLEAKCFHCRLNTELKESVEAKFKVMDQLEVVHPSSDSTICSGRIRKVVFPLLWIQVSSDSYTLLPFNSTSIFPSRWCENNQHPLVSFLPPRKRQISTLTGSGQQNDLKRRKKYKISENQTSESGIDVQPDYSKIYVNEAFDLGSLSFKQAGIDYILNEKSQYIKIYFNHKCFTGPSLSKSKISTLPQYVGPGPLRLVLEEVVTKVISVAYVPPRILNELSNASFEELLIQRNLKNTTPIEFKAKYQKRVHREDVPICLNPDDVALFCECLCEHLKCCYNLFGPEQYDGDDCPGHCRALTKSNKFMKRATYYRDKARAGEFIGSTSQQGDSQNRKSNAGGNKSSASGTSRPRYGGRGSSESTCSSVSRSDQVASRATSSSGGEDDHKNEFLNTVKEEEERVEVRSVSSADNEFDNNENILNHNQKHNGDTKETDVRQLPSGGYVEGIKLEQFPTDLLDHDVKSCEGKVANPNSIGAIHQDYEFNSMHGYCKESIANNPNDWTVDDVCRALEALGLSTFIREIKSEGIDGRALLLLDEPTILEYFQKSQMKCRTNELEKLCRFVQFAKDGLASILNHC